MAIQINTGLTPKWYTPDSQKDSDNPAKFKLNPLDQMTYLDVESSMAVRGDVVTFTKKSIEMCLRAGLVDWENVEDQNGRALKCSPHNFKYLDAELLTELAAELISMCRLSEDDEKNS